MENMKHAKKLLGLLLALTMVLSLAATAFATGDGIDAAQTETVGDKTEGSTSGSTTGTDVGGNAGDKTQPTGTITIENAVPGQEYKVYLMFTLESYDTDTGAYSYKITENWRNFVTTGYGKDYFAINEQGYVTMKEGVTVGDNSETAASIAKEALKYAKDNSAISPAATLSNGTGYTASGLTMGYYLVDSSLGTLCSLGTATDNVKIKEKNAEPTVDKKVLENSTGEYGKMNDAGIGDIVTFQATITAQEGAQNYVFHDAMQDTLEFVAVTEVTKGSVKISEGRATYTVKNPSEHNDCTFDVVFAQAFCDTLQKNEKIVITYTAKVLENATIGGGGNFNKCQLSYGENNKTTEPSDTKTYVWSFDILKYANGDKSKLLAGAKFVLLNQDGDKVATIADGKLTGWVNAPANTPADADSWPAGTVFITNETNNVVISGLDGGTYYLREVASPAGYNLLDGDTEVVIAPTTNDTGNTMTLSPVTAEVENKSGAQLPSTGGIGTTIFYVLGSALLIGAVVLLVARKRMNAEK